MSKCTWQYAYCYCCCMSVVVLVPMDVMETFGGYQHGVNINYNVITLNMVSTLDWSRQTVLTMQPSNVCWKVNNWESTNKVETFSSRNCFFLYIKWCFNAVIEYIVYVTVWRRRRRRFTNHKFRNDTWLSKNNELYRCGQRHNHCTEETRCCKWCE